MLTTWGTLFTLPNNNTAIRSEGLKAVPDCNFRTFWKFFKSRYDFVMQSVLRIELKVLQTRREIVNWVQIAQIPSPPETYLTLVEHDDLHEGLGAVPDVRTPVLRPCTAERGEWG